MPTRTNLIASGTTLASSATFAVDAGAPAAIHINGAQGAMVVVERYDGTSYYHAFDIYEPGELIVGIGTYRVTRPACATAYQVDVEK